MKRILCLALAILLTLGLTGCGEYHQGIAGTRPSQGKPTGPVDVNNGKE